MGQTYFDWVILEEGIIETTVSPTNVEIVEEEDCVIIELTTSLTVPTINNESLHDEVTHPPSVMVTQSSVEDSNINDRRTHNQHNNNNMSSDNFLRPSPSESMESFKSITSTASSTASYISDIHDEFNPFRIQTYLKYNQNDWTLSGGVKQAACPVSKKYKERTTYWQVHLTLLPLRKQRFKTKYRSTGTPIFRESFQFVDVPKQALSQLSLRYRLYGRFKRTGRKMFVGEVVVELSNLLYTINNEKDGEWWEMGRTKTVAPLVCHERNDAMNRCRDL